MKITDIHYMHPSERSSNHEEGVVNEVYKVGHKGGVECQNGTRLDDKESIGSNEAVKSKSSVLVSGADRKIEDEKSLDSNPNAGTLKGGSHIDPDQIPASSSGRLVSKAPKISRNPIAKSYGGDYSNGKDPVDLTQGDTPIENTDPQYSNFSETIEGDGSFFEPKDTQGGIYKKDEADTPVSSTSDIPRKKIHDDPLAIVPGGVIVGEYGEFSEATQAEVTEKYKNTSSHEEAIQHGLDSVNLRDENGLAKEVENVGLNDSQKDASNRGIKSDSDQVQEPSNETTDQEKRGTKDSDSSNGVLDEDSMEREKNKSVFNPAGIQGILKEMGKK